LTAASVAADSRDAEPVARETTGGTLQRRGAAVSALPGTPLLPAGLLDMEQPRLWIDRVLRTLQLARDEDK
jgi:hypothetical protein